MADLNSFIPGGNPKNTITIGKARFTFLTERMVRMEWSADGRFEDRATITVNNRWSEPVALSATRRGDVWTLATPALRLTYRATGARFNARNLRAEFQMNGRRAAWRYGQKDPGNLHGTVRTLDGAWGGKNWRFKKDPKTGEMVKDKYTRIDLGEGLISRSGWAVVDDSSNVVLDPALVPGRLWIAPRPAGARQDLYLLAHGHDYRGALADAARVFGRQPLPPRYAFGYWYSRYWAYTDREIEGLIRDFDTMNVPLDVMVIDMDWHLPGWTGYTWDRRYFPDPAEFLGWLKARDLKITLNLHPADGVGDHEAAFAAMWRTLGHKRAPTGGELPGGLANLARQFGRDPRRVGHIPFEIANPAYMDAYFKHLHHPLEKLGVDFWWMDWQQGNRGSAIPGFNPLAWLNHLHWEDQARAGRDRRPICFSRYGGLGAGRYPVGFSGDTVIAWPSLAYQPYFTATASNVLYGYWSHDIGGHFKAPTDPEMYTRWMQFGMFSPILRTHVSKSLESERRPWKFADPYAGVLMDCIRRRYELVPYLYGEARQGVDSGVSLLRPMYYDWPEQDAAYKAAGQYMFGSQMLVAPVTRPADARTELARARVWLPPGEWIDTALGKRERGGRWIERDYMIQEVPVFVRPGALIPGQMPVRRLRPGSYAGLVITAYPGADGAYELYEDDGVTQGYLRGESAMLPLRQELRGDTVTITVGPARGTFKGFRPGRALELRLPMTTSPQAVLAGGRALAWRQRLAGEGWSYDGQTATTVVRLARVDVARGVTIRLRFAPGGFAGVDGLKGLLSRLDRIAELTNLVSPVYTMHKDERMAVDAAQAGNRITRAPATFADERRRLGRLVKALPGALKAFQTAYRKRGEAGQKQTAILARARALMAATAREF